MPAPANPESDYPVPDTGKITSAVEISPRLFGLAGLIDEKPSFC